MKFLIIFFLLLTIIRNSFAQDYRKIKILIYQTNRIVLNLKGEFELKNQILKNKNLVFSLENGKINNNCDLNFNTNVIFIKNISDGYVNFLNELYKGDFYLFLNGDSFLLVEEIDIEEYLKGVLPNEISSSWNLEAIKAQAVAARSFAYYHKIQNYNNFYHIKKDMSSQVYSGINLSSDIFNKCIKETEDEVIVFENQIITAPFHSTCGGGTEDSGNVWGKFLPYLRYVPCNYCIGSPNYEWQISISESEIREKLNKVEDLKISRIDYIKGLSRSSSGRWRELRIIARPKDFVINANRFRLIIGAEKIRSTRFSVYRDGNKFIFKGKGWGHGVGLCQWGAKRMAEIGYKYDQIIRYYFRGTKIVKVKPELLGLNK